LNCPFDVVQRRRQKRTGTGTGCWRRQTKKKVKKVKEEGHG
jgi:hypothetical protein